MTTFKEFGLPEAIIQALERLNITTPTPTPLKDTTF